MVEEPLKFITIYNLRKGGILVNVNERVPVDLISGGQ